MTKLSAKAFRQELFLNVVLLPITCCLLILLFLRLRQPWVQVLLGIEVGFYVVIIAYSAYQLANPKAFKRGLIARNDERYQLIKDKARLASYLVTMLFLGACFSWDALGHLWGTTTISLAIWEFILLLISLAGLAQVLAKWYYQHRF